MEGFAVTCPLASAVSHLRSGSCTSSRHFGLGFLQTLPRGNALALLLAFGSANTWQEDFHLFSYVSCPTHTPAFNSAVNLRLLQPFVMPNHPHVTFAVSGKRIPCFYRAYRQQVHRQAADCPLLHMPAGNQPIGV